MIAPRANLVSRSLYVFIVSRPVAVSISCLSFMVGSLGGWLIGDVNSERAPNGEMVNWTAREFYRFTGKLVRSGPRKWYSQKDRRAANRYKPEVPLIEGEIGDIRLHIALSPAGGAILVAPPWRSRMMGGGGIATSPPSRSRAPRRWPGRP